MTILTFRNGFKLTNSILRASQRYQSTASLKSELPKSDLQLKTEIMDASIPFISQYGWTRESLELGCKELGMPESYHSLIIKKDTIDMILFFYSSRNTKSVDYMQSWRSANEPPKAVNNNTTMISGSPDASSQDLIKDLPLGVPKGWPEMPNEIKDTEILDRFLYSVLKNRLEMIIPVIDKWPQAMAMMANPMYAPRSLHLFAELVDDIWAAAGDKSSDMKWYAKRMAVAYVYNLSELHLIQDNSTDYEKTWIFLNNRLKDLRKLKENDLKSTINMMKETVGVFTKTTSSMLGLRKF